MLILFNIIYIDSATIDNSVAFENFKRQGFRKSFIVVTDIQKKTFLHPERAEEILKNKVKAKGLTIDKQEKFTWSVATEKAEFPIVYIQKRPSNIP